jgi:hypothetical protein
LKRISPVSAHFKYAAVEAYVWITRRFEIEVMPERQLNAAAFEE